MFGEIGGLLVGDGLVEEFVFVGGVVDNGLGEGGDFFVIGIGRNWALPSECGRRIGGGRCLAREVERGFWWD